MNPWDTLRNNYVANHLEYCMSSGHDGVPCSRFAWDEADNFLAQVAAGVIGTETYEESCYGDDEA